MKPYALHVPLSDRQKAAIVKTAKAEGITQGQVAKRLMYGKLSGEEVMRRADVSEGVEVSVKWPGHRKPIVVKRGLKHG